MSAETDKERNGNVSGDGDCNTTNENLDTDLKELSSNFTQVALSFERDSQLSGLTETLNDCLTSTDEFHTLTDLLSGDAQVSLEVIRAFAEKSPQIEALFARIDQLDAFVAKSKDALRNIEQAVTKAESELCKK